MPPTVPISLPSTNVFELQNITVSGGEKGGCALRYSIPGLTACAHRLPSPEVRTSSAPDTQVYDINELEHVKKS